MPRYRVFGHVLQSSAPLVGLVDCGDARPDWNLIVHPDSSVFPQRVEWFHRFLTPEGRTWMRVGAHGGAYFIRFPRMAACRLDIHDSRIDFYPTRRLPAHTIAHLAVDQALPLLISHQRNLVLHASAIDTPLGAVAFLGVSGAGKSTLAAAFALGGAAQLSDDALLVGSSENDCLPGHPARRLWPDVLSHVLDAPDGDYPRVSHYTTKVQVEVRRHDADPGPRRLRHLLILDGEPPGAAVLQAVRLSERDALASLLQHCYRLDFRDRAWLTWEFERLAGLVRVVPISRVAFKRDLERLGEVQRELLAYLASSSTLRRL